MARHIPVFADDGNEPLIGDAEIAPHLGYIHITFHDTPNGQRFEELLKGVGLAGLSVKLDFIRLAGEEKAEDFKEK
jgi:hypothetical protein